MEKKISYDKKMIWWTYLLSQKEYWGNGLTHTKLLKIKNHVFQITDIWYDLLIRHDFNDFPWNERKNNKDSFDHAIGNFSCSVYKVALDMGVVKKY